MASPAYPVGLFDKNSLKNGLCYNIIGIGTCEILPVNCQILYCQTPLDRKYFVTFVLKYFNTRIAKKYTKFTDKKAISMALFGIPRKSQEMLSTDAIDVRG